MNTSHTFLPLLFGGVGTALGMGPVFWAMALFLGGGRRIRPPPPRTAADGHRSGRGAASACVKMVIFADSRGEHAHLRVPVLELRSPAGVPAEAERPPAHAAAPSAARRRFSKMVTAAGFQLKGSGWYATDFKGGESKPAAKTEGGGDAKEGGKGGGPRLRVGRVPRMPVGGLRIRRAGTRRRARDGDGEALPHRGPPRVDPARDHALGARRCWSS